MKRKLEESKRQAELEKLQEENERFQKHRQQLKDKVRVHLSLMFSLISSRLTIIIAKRNRLV